MRAGISQKLKKVLTNEEKKADCLLIIGKIYFFSESHFSKSKFANLYLSYEKVAIIFDIKTLKVF